MPDFRLDIRPATRADVPQIFAFIRELAEFEREPDAVLATESMLENALFEEHSAEVLMAEIDGTPAAFALFFHNFSTWEGKKGLYLEDLYVTPDARGKGVGTALLKHLAGIAMDRDCGRFEWSVLDWNQPAIDVYRKIGATGLNQWQIQRIDGEALRKLAGR